MALILNVTNLRMTVATLYGTPGASGSLSLSQGTGIINTPNPITGTGTIALAVPVAVANGGTGTSTTLTQGSVVFAGASGVYSQDNANFFWDATNHRLGIGTTAPVAHLEIVGDSSNSSLKAGALEAQSYALNNSWLGENVYFDGANFKYRSTGFATRLYLSNGAGTGNFTIATAASGTAGTVATLTDRLTILNASGNVGIGTTAPVARLHLSAGGTNYDPSLTYHATAAWSLESASVELAAGVATTPPFAYWLQTRYSGSTAWALSINPLGGNVGIGTTSPGAKLDVLGTTRHGAFAHKTWISDLGASDFGAAVYLGQDNGTSQSYVRLNTSYALGAAHGPALVIARSTTTGAYDSDPSALTYANTAIFDSNGNVGIGTTAPGAKLSVAGTIEITAGSGGVLKFADGTSQASAAAGGGTVTGTGTATNVAFWTAGSTISSDNGLFWDNANKRLGVGLNSPGVTLQVAGPARITDAGATGSTGASYCQIFNSVGQIYVGVNDHANTFFTGSGADAACLYAAGGVNLVISTAATPRMAFTGANTGIGASYIAPGSVLDIKDNAATCLRLSGSTSGFVGLRPAAVAGSTTYQLPAADSTGTQYLRSNGAGVLTWGTPAGAGTVTTNGSLSAGMVTFIDPAGSTVITGEGNLFYDNLNNRLGILTSSPIAPLHVGAQTNAPVSLTPQILVDVAGSSYIVAKDTSDVTEAAFGADSTGAIVGSQTSSPLNFQTSGITRAVIPATGGFRLNGSSSGYVGLQGAAAAGSTTFTLPAADGLAGQVLQTNGSGILSFGSAGIAVFNVLSYGAVADAKYVTDAAMTSGSTTLTSASNLFTAGDVGKPISVTGAGAAGVVLFTTIAGFVGAGNVTLSAANASGGNISAKAASWGTDNTTAFTNAIAAANTSPSFGAVYAPPGQYRISTHITVPDGVRLFGDATGPRWATIGTCLHAVENPLSPGGTPFIGIGFNSTCEGLAIIHPNQQVTAGVPISYPFSIKGKGYCTIKNIFLYNSYQGIDMASETVNPYNGVFTLRGIYGQPLFLGIDVNKSYDVSEISDVHFWPFWSQDSAFLTWQHANAIGIRFGRSDYQFMRDIYITNMGVGIQLNHNALVASGGTSGTWTNIQIDYAKTGIDAYETGFNGVHITNLYISGGSQSAPATFDSTAIKSNFDAVLYVLLSVSNAHFWNLLNYGIYIDNPNGNHNFSQCFFHQMNTVHAYINRGATSLTNSTFFPSYSTAGINVTVSCAQNVLLSCNQLFTCSKTVSNATTLDVNNQP